MLRISENINYTNYDVMQYVIVTLEWKLPRLPYPSIQVWLLCSVSLQFTCVRSFASLQRQVATLTCILFHVWTLLRNNNMETNLQVFTSSHCSR